MTKDTIQSIRERYAPVDNIQEQAKRIADWSVEFFGDPENRLHYWIRTIIEDYHLKIYEALWSQYQLLWITGPRGFAKTTLAALVDPLYRICYALDPYIVLIGKRNEAGTANLRNIKRELAKNEKLKAVYGNLKPDRAEKLAWSAHEIQTRNGVFLRSIGIMGDIRGSLEAMYRPTLIIIEDPQAVKHLNEPSTLELHQDYIDRDVVEAVDPAYGKVRIIGNLLGQGCVLLNLQSDKRWQGIDFGALINEKGEKDINGKSIWESQFPTKKLHAERDALIEVGKKDIFMYEKMNIPVDIYVNNLKGYNFHDCSYRRLSGQNVLISDEYTDAIPIYTYLAIDPAFSKAKNADPRALVVFAKGQFPVGNGRFSNGLWVLEYDYNRMDPADVIERALNLHKKYYFRGVIIETIGGQLIYSSLMTKALITDEFYSRHPFTFTPVGHHEYSKEDRIYARFHPKIKLGQFFIRKNHHELMKELDLFIQCTDGIHLLDALEIGDQYSDTCTEQFTYNIPRRYRRLNSRIDIPDVRNVMDRL